MKCEIIIDPKCEKKVVIYAKASSALTEEIKRIAEENTLFGHMSGEIVQIGSRKYQLHRCHG